MDGEAQAAREQVKAKEVELQRLQDSLQQGLIRAYANSQARWLWRFRKPPWRLEF